MANDPLALSGIGAGLPQEAEYDAVYAAVTATERGRWFLTEFASRNRHADTDTLMDAIARIEVAVRSDAPSRQSPRLPDLSAATERLADIAFGLRERAADAALCDALDVAVREICAACATVTEHRDAKNGATVPDLIEVTAADQTAPTLAHQVADDVSVDVGSPSSCEAFDLPLQDKEKFAEAAAALAASLGALSAETAPASEPHGALVGEAESSSEPQDTLSAAAIPQHDYTALAASQPAASVPLAPRWHIEAPDFVFHQSERRADDTGVESSGRPDQPHALLPGPQLLPSPDEDPAELFEPIPKRVAPLSSSGPVTSVAKSPTTPLALAASALGQAGHATEIPAPRPTVPTVRPLPRPAPVNPLAALRALTEEELIALFG